MVTQINTKRILIFLAFAFGIPWTAALVSYLTIGRQDLIKAATLANSVFISTPALANLATRLITREGWGHTWLRPNFRRGWRFYLAAWLLPLLAASVGGAIYFLVFPQSFDSNAGAARQTVASLLPSLTAASFWTVMLVITVLTLITGLVINGLASIGEEFGWRAYLLQKLMAHFTGAEPASGSAEVPVPAGLYAAGARKASLLIGVIWGVWHWPLLFFSLKYDPEMPIVLPLVYVLSTCLLSVLLCWVTLRSGSVWPASIGHGTINATASLARNLLNGPPNYLLGPGPSGLIGGLGYLALALVLLFHRRAFVGEKQRAEIDGVRATEYPTLV